jgi:SNF2 family DNA or RNA helicase
LLPAVAEYQTKVKPYPHQLEALGRMNGRETFALLMAMRTGKTKVLLDNFGQLEANGEVSDLLVIAPAGVYRTWETAIREHVADTLLPRLVVHTWSSGSKSQKTELLRQAFLTTDKPRVLLMNVEALSSVKSARQFCANFLRDRNKAMIAVDESTIIKTPRTERTKFILRELAPRAKFRRILSGLPTPRSPLDMYCQMEFLSPAILGYGSYWAFRHVCAITRRIPIGGRTVEVEVGYHKHIVEWMQRQIEPHSFRVPFRPKIPSTYTIREVELTNEQRRIYNEIKNYATARLDEENHVTATIVIAQILRLHQVLCGHVSDERGQLHDVPEYRTKELLALLEDYNGKAVIWCSYDHSIKKVCQALAREYPVCGTDGQPLAVQPWPHPHIARFWGGNTKTREAEEYRFSNSPNCRFLVATPSAGGRGRTWSVADLVVYFSSTYDLEHRDQSEQRVQGLDKVRQVDYIDLIAPGTVETKILSTLRRKINMAATITGDQWKEWII